MDYREGVRWAYRLLLNRDPENDAVLDFYVGGFTSIVDLRNACVESAEFASLLDRAGNVLPVGREVDWEAGWRWAHLVLLGRHPTPAESAACPVQFATVNDLRLRFVLRREFEIRGADLRLLTNFAVINAFAPFPTRDSIPGYYRDFLGSRTKIDYLGNGWNNRSGYVQQSVPRDHEPGLHGTSEWVGTLRSVLEAGESLTAFELGAGWGPWLVVTAKAAALRGIGDLHLTGVEASEIHHNYMRENLLANGIAADQHRLLRAAAGPMDGTVTFPKIKFAEDYGANAVFSESEAKAASERGDLEEVDCVSLNTLMKGHDRVDLVHIDIQGHEEPVIRTAIETLNRTTRRLVIGTHSRPIEAKLMDLLSDHGWICEYEVPCKLEPEDSEHATLVVDGEQIWRNPRVRIANANLA